MTRVRLRMHLLRDKLSGAAAFCALMAMAPCAMATSASQAPVQAFDPDLIQHDPNGKAYISIRDSYGILTAMEHGDPAQLHAIRDGLGKRIPAASASYVVMAGLCDAAIARVQGDLTGSDAFLDRARKAAGPLGDPARSINPLDLLFETVRVGNLMLEGRTQDWARAHDRLVQVYFAPIRQFYRLPDLEFRNIDPLTLSVPADTIPQPSVSGPESEHVDFEASHVRIGGRSLPLAQGPITLGDIRTQAIFDTGSFLGSIPAAMARQQHFTVVGHIGQQSDGSTRTRTAEIVLVPALTIGRTTLTNQMMTISQASTVIVGMQQLSQLRHVVFSEHALHFGRGTPLACTDRMTLRSMRNGMTMSLLLPVSHDGTEGHALVDTGDNTLEVLTVRLRSFPAALTGHLQSEEVETMQGRFVQHIAIRPQTLRIGAVSHEADVKYELGDWSMPPAITFGAFRYGALQFDRTEGVACFR